MEFGCGYETFTIPAAQMIQGTVYALDIETKMIEITKAKVNAANQRNVELFERDFTEQGSGLPDSSIDFVMLFNILHADERMEMLVEAWRVLSPNGKLAVIHWNYDASTPRGPSMSVRPRSEECCAWAEQVGFVRSSEGLIDLPPYHNGLVFNR